jgi:hypothetical protein
MTEHQQAYRTIRTRARPCKACIETDPCAGRGGGSLEQVEARSGERFTESATGHLARTLLGHFGCCQQSALGIAEEGGQGTCKIQI